MLLDQFLLAHDMQRQEADATGAGRNAQDRAVIRRTAAGAERCEQHQRRGDQAAGHGSSSAFITILLRFRIEQMRKEYLRGRFSGDFTPARILTLLNRDLLQAGLEKHITLFMGLLDDSTNSLCYSVAGHQPLPLLFQDGGANFIPLERSSFPIGLLGEAEYFDETIALSEDFALVLFSDGIFEALKLPGMVAKESRLREVVAACKGDFDSIKKTLGLSSSLSFPDDIAVMSVTRS
jgi:serine phosphatase RsbU (regulator of sigma subunit)